MNCTTSIGRICADPNCPVHGLAIYRQGYRAGFADGRKSAGQPSLATNQCLGGGGDPDPFTIKKFASGHPGRGCCTICGTEFRLTWNGKVRRHRRKASE